jgi:hypothetical protein
MDRVWIGYIYRRETLSEGMFSMGNLEKIRTKLNISNEGLVRK